MTSKEKTLKCHDNHFKQCCCTCKHQIAIYPGTFLKYKIEWTSHLHYWACVLPLTDNQRFCYSSDDEHSVGCECYLKLI